VTPTGERTDAFVIGGGPAGLAAAIAASRKGFSVTLADGCAPPVDKACGEGMMPASLAALRELGVELPAGMGYRLRGIRFVEGDTRVAAEFPGGQGFGIRRTVLHSLLISQAGACGVKMLWNSPVVGIEGGQVRLKHKTITANWIVGADGGQSRVRRWSELDSSMIQERRLAYRRHYRVRPWTEFTEVYWGPRMQAYVTPTSTEEVCIVTMGKTPQDARFDRALELLPELRGRLANATLCGRERGAISAMASLACVWRGKVALVGDASGGVDAITGEGLRLAFQQSQVLAQALHAGDLRQYGRAHERLARGPFRMGWLMLKLGKHDGLRARLLGVLQWNPELFARLLAIHVGQSTTQDVVKTGTQLAWQYLAN
jgi:menaquinone-9 beta-reductase